MEAESRETKFLKDINRYVPANVDWKRGAIDYLEQLIKHEGDHNELYHLVKPFLGGPDFGPFFSEMYGFLNILQHIDLPMKSKVLDVACGPGWTSHFLAKLGYEAFGIDISPDLIDIAKKRIAMEPFSPYMDAPLSASFSIHDIENDALDVDTVFSAAFFESALHHFYNPVAVIKNISKNLQEDGILCIWEGAAPKPGTAAFNHNIEIMTKYRTLERPYTREQMIELLEICGYSSHEFYSPVNGLYNLEKDVDMASLNNQLSSGRNWNICIASRRNDFFERRSGLTNMTERIRSRQMDGFRLIRVLWYALTLKDNDQFISRLYTNLLGREPDAEGFLSHRKGSKNVLSRMFVIYSFLCSAEYKNLNRRTKR
jgi:SAM-dependent methyltransferase